MKKKLRELGGLGLASLLAIALTSGCGKPGYQISGTVAVNGEPVPLGYINLAPDRSAGNDGLSCMATINEGQIHIDGRLCAGGPHLMDLKCYDGVPYKLGGGTVTTGKELAPAQVRKVDLPNSNVSFTIDIEAADGPNGPATMELDID